MVKSETIPTAAEKETVIVAVLASHNLMIDVCKPSDIRIKLLLHVVNFFIVDVAYNMNAALFMI